MLLHACCAPCSSAVLERLGQYFAITLYYDNPNIQPFAEYRRRRDEAERLVSLVETKYPLQFAEGPWDEELFLEAVRGLEGEPEGGRRCAACFAFRLGRSAEAAKMLGIALFSTTLSISPHKNAEVLNETGEAAGQKAGVAHLPADFKKQDGYRRSLQLSETYGLYRQDYCGCRFSRRQAPPNMP